MLVAQIIQLRDLVRVLQDENVGLHARVDRLRGERDKLLRRVRFYRSARA